MLRNAIAFGFAATMPFVVAAAVITPRFVDSSTPADPLAIDEPAMVVPPSFSSDALDDDDGSTDLLGNPVSDAIARYKYDALGSLYELHSPQTEVPRLSPPKT